jgi:hypothetical protein
MGWYTYTDPAGGKHDWIGALSCRPDTLSTDAGIALLDRVYRFSVSSELPTIWAEERRGIGRLDRQAKIDLETRRSAVASNREKNIERAVEGAVRESFEMT